MLLKKWNKRAQTTAEYAVLIGLVIAAVLVMQVYVKRSLQGRIMQESTALGPQFEPGYLASTMNTAQDSKTNELITGGGSVSRSELTNATRTGNQTYNYP